ncbi:MAG: DUF3152 domain-containing protein [Actinomycetota bacterium]|nr:DUF3152 domain-containing protein [Actinomycetota bacterium]
MASALYRRWGPTGVWLLELGIAMIVTTLLAGATVVFAGDSGADPSPPLVTTVDDASASDTAPNDSSVVDPVPESTPAESPSERASPHEEEEIAPLTYRPTGVLVTVPGSEGPSGSDPVRTFSVEVEKGLPIDPSAFAQEVGKVLGSARSWGVGGGFSVQRVNSNQASFKVLLASPQTTDELCSPLQTNGIFSCAQGSAAILNAMRWMEGADAYGDDLESYRKYMINHEVGHVFGHGHVECPAAGELAPVMVQQTKGVGSCEPNPWPFP